MSTFTITEVSDNVRAYDTTYGPKKAYRVHLRNGDGTDHLNIEFRRNADSPAPTVGQQLEGELVDQGQYGQRLQLANRGGPGASWTGAKAPVKDFKADPVKQAAIAMEHAQKAAIDILSLAAEKADGYSLPETVGGVTEQVKMVAKMLYGQIAEVSEAAK
jgi:hypothetical protein